MKEPADLKGSIREENGSGKYPVCIAQKPKKGIFLGT